MAVGVVAQPALGDTPHDAVVNGLPAQAGIGRRESDMAGRLESGGQTVVGEWRFGKEKSPRKAGFFYFLAERTGLEPATPGVTGRYSNQLNYRSKEWRPYGDSNPGTHRERVMS